LISFVTGREQAGFFQKPVRERGFPVVDVRDYAEISDMILSRHGKILGGKAVMRQVL
jgi:hypothetical protein